MGYGRALGTRLFDIIEPFADYAFGRSHAFGYALIAYQTAYLKAHYPVEYLACLLTSVKSSLEKAAVYIAECRALGVKVLPPDINVSMANFTAMSPDEVPAGVTLPTGSPGAISFGLSAVRNVGEGLVAQLLAERQANGSYASFHEFADRVPEPVLNKRAVESLIKAGAFDSLGHPRRGLLGVFEQVTNTTLSRRRERELGVMSLFGDVEQSTRRCTTTNACPVPDVEFDKAELLRAEKEMLGLYVSDHPLFGKEGGAAPQGRAGHRRPRRPRRRYDGAHRRRRHRVEPAVHQARRPDGDVHARGSRRRDRGDAVPADAHRARAQAGRRPDRRRSRPPRQARREPDDRDLPVPGGARRARGRCPDVDGQHPRRAPRTWTRSTASSTCWRPIPGRPRSSSTWAPSGSVSPTSSASISTGSFRRSAWPSAMAQSPCRMKSSNCGLSPRRRRVTGRGTWPSGCRQTMLRRSPIVTSTNSPRWVASFGIGEVSKAKEDWVLITTARIDDKLHGFMFSTLERIGGTPCVLLGLISVKRTTKRDQVLRGLMKEAYHRALMAFPDEDVVVGSRFVNADALIAFKDLDDVTPRPGVRAVGEERAWGRRLAKRFDCDAGYDEQSFAVKSNGQKGFVDYESAKPESVDPRPGRPVQGRPEGLRGADRLRLDDGRRPRQARRPHLSRRVRPKSSAGGG